MNNLYTLRSEYSHKDMTKKKASSRVMQFINYLHEVRNKFKGTRKNTMSTGFNSVGWMRKMRMLIGGRNVHG